jgi:cytochrome c556
MGTKALVTLVMVSLVSPAIAQRQAERRPYNLIMKDIGATVEILRKDLDSDLAAAAATAGKLEGLLKETEDFWTEFKTKDAIDAAKGAQGVVRAVAAAARNRDVQNAKNAASGLGKFCAACHNSHREQLPDKSYRIKP